MEGSHWRLRVIIFTAELLNVVIFSAVVFGQTLQDLLSDKNLAGAALGLDRSWGARSFPLRKLLVPIEPETVALRKTVWLPPASQNTISYQ